MRVCLPLLLLINYSAIAANNFYCPTNHGYIHIGMTTAEVSTACGQPTNIAESNQPLMQQIPVTQLMYSNLEKGAVYSGLDSTYQMWSLPSGTTQTNMQINIINNQVSEVQLNGSGENATSVCGGTPIQVGDPADSVYSACGNPDMVNQTYIKRPIRSNVKPIVWTYEIPYQSSFRLTFLNDILQSIDQ